MWCLIAWCITVMCNVTSLGALLQQLFFSSSLFRSHQTNWAQVSCEGRSQRRWGECVLSICSRKKSVMKLSLDHFYGLTQGLNNQTPMWSTYAEVTDCELKTSDCFGKISVFESNLSPRISHCRQVSVSAVQRPGFQSTGKKVGTLDNKLHKGPLRGVPLTHAPITMSTACILFQTLLSAPHTPWENICFCTQIPILLPHTVYAYYSGAHTHKPYKLTK